MFFQWIHYLFGLQRLECTDHAETCWHEPELFGYVLTKYTQPTGSHRTAANAPSRRTASVVGTSCSASASSTCMASNCSPSRSCDFSKLMRRFWI